MKTMIGLSSCKEENGNIVPFTTRKHKFKSNNMHIIYSIFGGYQL